MSLTGTGPWSSCSSWRGHQILQRSMAMYHLGLLCPGWTTQITAKQISKWQQREVGVREEDGAEGLTNSRRQHRERRSASGAVLPRAAPEARWTRPKVRAPARTPRRECCRCRVRARTAAAAASVCRRRERPSAGTGATGSRGRVRVAPPQGAGRAAASAGSRGAWPMG
jgi:hypothetical protein